MQTGSFLRFPSPSYSVDTNATTLILSPPNNPSSLPKSPSPVVDFRVNRYLDFLELDYDNDLFFLPPDFTEYYNHINDLFPSEE